MEWLEVNHGMITDRRGQPVRLRGVCAGGWMTLESFINGFPGVECDLRQTMAEILGPNRAEFFFERWLDYLLSEDDFAFIRACGANVVRLPLNYRHFESDSEPFVYLEKGFARLEQAVRWAEAHNLYVILDLHAVQGWQNPDWHSDNPTQRALFWRSQQDQERFMALWQEIARRYAGNPTVAGYDLINEPLTNELSEIAGGRYTPDWATLNRIYRRTAAAIRAVDPQHILFLEGDGFSSRFSGLEAPFAGNLVYSSHNYNRPGWGPGPYPGLHKEGYWDRQKVAEVFAQHEGPTFAREHNVPIWVGEFGSVFNGRPEDRPDRLRGLDDTLDIYEAYGAHWTLWTYKDLGVMGWVTVDPESEYIQRIQAVLQAKTELHTDTWMYWMPPTPARRLSGDLARLGLCAGAGWGHDEPWVQGYLAKSALAGTFGRLLQVGFARLFQGCSEAEIDRVLASFALRNCRPHEAVVEIVKKHTLAEAA